MRKIIHKTAAALISLLIAAAVFYFAYQSFFNPRRGEPDAIEKSLPLEHLLTKEDALEDALYLFDKLKYNHPAWLERNNPNVEAVNSLCRDYQLNIKDMTVLELWRSLSSIVSVLHDGHTKIAWKNPGEELYIENFTIPRLYSRPLKINYQKVEEILAEHLLLTSYEYDFYAIRKFFDSSIYTKSSLEFMGVDTSTGVTFTYNDKGNPVNFYFEFVPCKNVIKDKEVSAAEPWVSYTIDEDASLGIFVLTSCDLNDHYRNVLRSFFSEVEAKFIKHIAVDLRGNGGGNSGVANAFLSYIDIDSYKSWDSAVRYGPVLWKNKNVTIKNKQNAPAFSGSLYVLTDVYSYSSAMDFAMLIKDNNLGLIIGEPSGNSPDSYGDNLYFQMPNSKLYFSLSHKKWYRINKDKAGLPIEPDYECPSEDAIKTLYKIILKN